MTRILLFVFFILIGCSKENETQNRPVSSGSETLVSIDETSSTGEQENTYASIDFSNWKLTLPVDENNNGSPDEYLPASLVNGAYRSNNQIKPFMYDQIEDSSIVFYTYPQSSTTNSSYSRTELRELINPSNSRINWTLAQGGEMRGRLKLETISKDAASNMEYHKTIVMQIHGIISISDIETHGFSSNNGPPLIKIYWKDGFLWCHKKSLVDEATSGDALLEVSSSIWTDEKDNLGYVGFEPFDFRITASNAKIEVQLNENEPLIYQDISLEKWPFENYYKAGNYLGTNTQGAFSYVKFYSLEITH